MKKSIFPAFSSLYVALLAAVFTIGGASPSFAQSFDCQKASTPTEKLICADKPLGVLDESLVATLREIFARSPERKAPLLAEQRGWIAKRDKQCAPASGQGGDAGKAAAIACLSGAYQQQIAALKDNSLHAAAAAAIAAAAVAPAPAPLAAQSGQPAAVVQQPSLLSPNLLSPVTANKVEGPATGQLPDKIRLRIENSANFTLGVSGKTSLSVSFCADVTATENVWSGGRVVQQSVTRCRTPDRKLHLTGRRQLTGVQFSPDVEGLWRWDSDYRLTFKPKNPWPTGQTYRLGFDPSPFPESVELENGAWSFVTQALSANVTQMDFFQDPNDVENRGVSTIIEFNAPVDAQSVRDHLRFTLEELTDAAKPSERVFVTKTDNLPFDIQLNSSGLRGTVTTPIKTMPEKERFLRVALSPGVTAQAGGQPLLSSPDFGSNRERAFPASSNLRGSRRSRCRS